MARSSFAIRHAWSGSDDVAWAEAGSGDALLVGGWWMSHLVHDREYPPLRAFVDELARHRRVIRLDPPGTGLTRSDAAGPADVVRHLDAMSAVLDAADAERVTLLAGSSGCPVAIEFAARHPDRVERLILSGSYLRGADIAAEHDRSALVELVRRSWGVGGRVMSDIFYPDATAEEQAAYLAHQRATGSGEVAAAALAAVYEVDASAAAAEVRAPALVLHRRGDRAIPLALGLATSRALPDARLEILDGSAHHPWHGDSAAVLRHALAFAGVEPSRIRPPASGGASAAAPESPISAREQEVLLLVARGLTDAQIADALFLSIHTVHRHVANARRKLGVPSRSAAAAWVSARAG